MLTLSLIFASLNLLLFIICFYYYYFNLFLLLLFYVIPDVHNFYDASEFPKIGIAFFWDGYVDVGLSAKTAVKSDWVEALLSTDTR